MSITQLVMMGIEGTSLTPAEREVLSSAPPGGIILFSRNCPTVEACKLLVGEIQELAARHGAAPLLIAIDQECGPVCRLREGFPEFPGAALLGEKNELADTASTAWKIGGCLKDLGVNLNLAPVADLACSGSAVLAGRCFAADPGQVAAQVAAYIRGLQGSGIAACAKHFPGHGSVPGDSHTLLPTSDLSLESLQASHLQPFFAAIEANVKVIMTAHLQFTAIDPRWPVTFSRFFLNDLLRRRLGFSGVILSDDLDMAAVAGDDLAATMVQGLSAGLDLVLWGRNMKKGDDPRRVFARLTASAAAMDEEQQKQLAEARARVAALRSWVPQREC
ncbi:MAG: beta-N-acetylhexosaminidase [Deltaproteobacteria bacterium]|nr:beta-N-acetylhexosaminidase [Candidatus Anaeroferrophillus wilburensis]MBN2888165.1 beta-N-acetylhexosaminidase [Deltaproteobacteria bacterium]